MSIVVDLDILRTSVWIYINTHRIFLHGSHNEVEAVADLEAIDLVHTQ